MGMRGRTYNLNLKTQPVHMREMLMMNYTTAFFAGTHLHKQPIIQYPNNTRRILGRMWPGEERRKLRKTLERKETRKQAAQLCKFMLFKNGKFIPGKMV